MRALSLVACAALVPACAPPEERGLLRDGTQRAGIAFEHVHGGVGMRELPETMGGGVALLDYDRDGALDVYLSQSGPMRTPEGTESRAGARNELYRNLGDARFEEVPRAAGAGDPLYGQGVAAADVDGDGWVDLLSLNWGPNALYRNREGTFEDVTFAAGLEPYDEWSVSAAFFDAEGDGDLDLYIVNYLQCPPAIHEAMGMLGGFPSYPSPDRFAGASDRFYRNEGSGSFSDRTVEVGMFHPHGKGLGVTPVDLDLDGLLDVFVANDSVPNFLFRNRGQSRFEEVAVRSGVAFNDDGRTEACMGVDAGDVDEDGDFDLFVTNLDLETNTLYANRFRTKDGVGAAYAADVTFADDTSRSGLGEPSRNRVGFGALFEDVDGDGDLDLLVANGHIIDNVSELADNRSYPQPDALFLGDGRGRFETVGPERAGSWLAVETVARGSAAGDLDGDGRTDFVLAANTGPPRVLLAAPASGRHLRLVLEGPSGNPAGLGSSVFLELEDGTRLLRRIESTRSYASASEPVLATGLPAPLKAIEVLWPGGARERYEAGAERTLEGEVRLRWRGGERIDR